jgi:2-polyprenyl-3-methyl-5-hydroxy-6-metoxy-1,4-benzoquinol methylase
VGEKFSCSCGREIGALVEGVAVVTNPTPYWGEISQEKMQEVLAASSTAGWRSAVSTCLPPKDRGRITNTARAAFQDILPIPHNSRVLDVGAGLGIISTEIARHHRVVALEGVWERAQFIAIRKKQDRLQNLTVLNGDLNSVDLGEEQFDAIIVNGVLEWVGLFDLAAPPEQVQLHFLQSLRRLLTPRGIIYVAIENRIGWSMFLGSEDHSGLKYTSLMPRFLARWVCAHGSSYRSRFNTGYRTYTYSYWGYKKLFGRAGLQIATALVPTSGYTTPTEMVPIHQSAIRTYTYGSWINPPVDFSDKLRNMGKRLFANELCWRMFGPDFAFILEKRNA